MYKMSAMRKGHFYRMEKILYAPENLSVNNKGSLSVVLCPSIESEIDHLAKLSDYIVIRELSRYVVHKKINYPLYGQMSRNVLTDDDAILKMIKSHKDATNLQNIESVYLLTDASKSSALSSYNALLEVNDVLNDILTNPKDKRTPQTKRVDLVNYLNHCLTVTAGHQIFDKYNIRNLFIPVNIWIGTEPYKSDDIFSIHSSSFISMIYNSFKNDPSLAAMFVGWNVIFTNFNEVMILDGSELASTGSELAKLMQTNRSAKIKRTSESSDPFHIKLKSFIHKCKSSTTGGVSRDYDEDGINSDLNNVAVESEAKVMVEKILSDKKIDPATIGEENMDKLVRSVESDIKAGKGDESLKTDVALATKQIKQGAESKEVLDNILAARLSGKSLESYNRDTMLKEKYQSNFIIDPNGKKVMLSDIINKEVHEPVHKYKVHAAVMHPEMQHVEIQNFPKTYNDNLFMKDLIAILSHFSTCKPALFMISDIEQEDMSDRLNRIMRYSVTFEDENRKRHNLKFLLPKFYKDAHVFINGSIKDLIGQKTPMPITKISPDLIQLSSSSYNKIFITRLGNNTSPKLTRLLKIIRDTKYNKIIYSSGNALLESKMVMTTIEYDEFASKVYLLILGKYKLHFNLTTAYSEIGKISDSVEGHEYIIPLGINIDTKKKYFLDVRNNVVLDESGKGDIQLSDFIMEKVIETHPEAEKDLSSISAGSRFIYSNATVMSKDIPVILLAASTCKGGLSEVLSRAKIKYRLTDRRESIDKNNEDIVPFSDGYLIYQRYPYEASILMNGLASIPTKEYSIYDMDHRETYFDIYENLYNQGNIIEALENFKQLFMDPITVDVQTQINGPTNFTDMLLYGNDMLADNSYTSDISYLDSRVRNNEIILAYLYKVLATQYGKMRINKSLKFTIPEDSVIKEILKGNSMEEHSTVNPNFEADMALRVSQKGLVGLNVEQAFTLEKRSFHDTMVGTVGLATAPSGSVGIVRFMTHNAKVLNSRGFVKVRSLDEMTGFDVMTPSELASAYLVDSSDASRAGMGSNQSKQMLATNVMHAPIISYDMERIIPYMSKDFSHTAKQDGKVVLIENDIMIIQYADGTYDDVDLSDRPLKHTNAGKFTMNQLDPLVRVGDKVKANQVVAINRRHISTNDIFGDPVAMNGTIMIAAYGSNGNLFEDSTYLSETASEFLGTKQTKQITGIIGKYANIQKIVKIGDYVSYNDPLLIYNDSDDEFGSKILDAMNAENDVDVDVDVVRNSNIYATASGVVVDIQAFHAVDSDELTPSLKKTISNISKKEDDKIKTLNKYHGFQNSNTIIKTVGKVEPDAYGRVGGIDIGEDVMFVFYIEYLDILGNGDKVTYGSAIKGVTSFVMEDRLRPYMIDDDRFKADVFIATIGITKRMAMDIHKLGGENFIGIVHKRNMYDKYYEDLKKGRL